MRRVSVHLEVALHGSKEYGGCTSDACAIVALFSADISLRFYPFASTDLRLCLEWSS